MRITLIFLLVGMLLGSAFVSAQSRFLPGERPVSSGHRTFVSMDFVPRLLGYGTNISYTISTSPNLGFEYFVTIPNGSQYSSSTYRGTSPPQAEQSFFALGMGMHFNLTKKDLDAMFLYTGVEAISVRETTWTRTSWGDYNRDSRSAGGIYLSSTVGHRLFYGILGISAELGVQLRLLGDDLGTESTFYSGGNIMPLFRIRAGLGF